MTRKCATIGCNRGVPTDKLMCYAHWMELPLEDQRFVWDSYYDLVAGKKTAVDHYESLEPMLERQRLRLNPTPESGLFGLGKE
jgi:hypothetical protein